MARRFDAATDRISRSGTMPADFTITGWIYLSADQDTYTTFCRVWTSGLATVGTWSTESDGTSGPNWFTGGGSLANATNLVVGEWRRVAVSRTAAGAAVLYVATPTGSVEVDSGSVGTNSPAGITIGGRDTADATEWFNGRAAYFRVFDSILTQAQIVAEWAATAAVVPAWADWPLDTDLLDISGNGRHLSAGSTATTTEAGPPIPSGTTGVLTTSIPMQTVTVAATATDAGTVAGSIPLQTAQLAATVTDQAALAGALPMQTLSAAGTVQQAGALAASVPLMQAAVVADVRAGADLSGSIPMQQVAVVTDVRDEAALAGAIPLQGVQVAADVTAAGVLAGSIPLPAVQIVAGSGPSLGQVAGAIPMQTATLAAAVTVPAVLAGSIPLQSVRFTTTPQASGVLHAGPVRDLAGVNAGPVFDVAGLHARI